MRKLGTTSNGMVIVEMTEKQYEALLQLHQDMASTATRGTVPPAAAAKMTHSQRVDFVADRLKKLSPKTRDAVVHSIETMFQFTGGIEADEIEKLLMTLGRKNFFQIAPTGKVTYPKT